MAALRSSLPNTLQDSRQASLRKTTPRASQEFSSLLYTKHKTVGLRLNSHSTYCNLLIVEPESVGGDSGTQRSRVAVLAKQANSRSIHAALFKKRCVLNRARTHAWFYFTAFCFGKNNHTMGSVATRARRKADGLSAARRDSASCKKGLATTVSRALLEGKRTDNAGNFCRIVSRFVQMLQIKL